MLIFLLFLDIVSIVSPKLLDLSDALDSKDETGKKTGTGFEQFFGIPLGSDAAQFEKYGVYDPKSTRQQLKWPTKESINGTSLDASKEYRIAFEKDNKPISQKGKVYFAKNDTVDVYLCIKEAYMVELVKDRFAVLFSKSPSGSTITNITVDADTVFSIYAGTPDDDNELLYTYNEKARINAIYIQEEVFYIVSNGTKFKFWVSDGGVSPLEKIFGNIGLVMTPQYPAMPDKIYLNTPITVIPQAVDRAVNVKLTGQLAAETVTTTTETPTTVTTTTSGSSSFLQLDASIPSVGSIKITAGPNKCTIPTISTTELTGDCDIILPANSTSFQVESTKSAYVILFDIEDLPVTTSSPATTPKPTAKPTTAPECTCPPTTFPTTRAPNTACPPVSTCPPVVTCPASCITTTTEIPTTTDGAATVFAVSSFTILCAYYLL